MTPEVRRVDAHDVFQNGMFVFAVVSSSMLFGQDREKSVCQAPFYLLERRVNDPCQRVCVRQGVQRRERQSRREPVSPEAQVIDKDGTTSQGRDAIEKTFAAIFADSPKGRIRVDVDSIRFIGSALAVETGRATVAETGSGTPDATRYTAVHIRSRSGQWMMGFVRDTPETELTNSDRLKALEWMIGDWIDESPESIVMTSCKWSDNKNFILQDVHVRMRGRDAMHLTQRIGWDPLTKQIKAWVFDSQGGYGESLWTRDGNRWLAKATAVRRDGTTASMTNIFTPTGKDSYTWRSTDRVVGGEVLAADGGQGRPKPPQAAAIASKQSSEAIEKRRRIPTDQSKGLSMNASNPCWLDDFGHRERRDE